MPSLREAQARVENLAAAAKLADKARAEKITQSKKAQKVQEAQAVRKIQKNLELLSINDTWSLKAQTWSEDQKMLDNLMTCAHHVHNKSVLLLEPGARRRGPGVDGSEPDRRRGCLSERFLCGRAAEGCEGRPAWGEASWSKRRRERTRRRVSRWRRPGAARELGGFSQREA